MSTVGWTKATTTNRLEDLRWMHDTGESGRGAAARLGLDYRTLDKWARANRVPFWGQMLTRNPCDWNEYAARRSA